MLTKAKRFPRWRTIIVGLLTLGFLVAATWVVYIDEDPAGFVSVDWEDLVIDPEILGITMVRLFIPVVSVLVLGSTAFFDAFVTQETVDVKKRRRLGRWLFFLLLLNLFFTVWRDGPGLTAITDGLLIVLLGALLLGWRTGLVLGVSSFLFYTIYDSFDAEVPLDSLDVFFDLFFGTFYDLSFVALLCSGIFVGLLRDEIGPTLLRPLPLFLIGFGFEWLPSWLNFYAFRIGDVIFEFLPGAIMTGLTLMILGLFAQQARGRAVATQLAHSERMQAEAELRALRAQINPHFLFNSISTIQYHARTHPKTAYDLLDNLADIFRAAFRSDHFIALEEEFATVEAYLHLEQARLRERLTVEWHIAPEVDLAMLVPSLVLQPIVENSIVHGIAPKLGGGRLVISASNQDQVCQVTIVDDGLGFDQTAPTVKGHGIGQTNVFQRMQSLYGAAFLPEIKSLPGQGTSVTLRFPIKT